MALEVDGLTESVRAWSRMTREVQRATDRELDDQATETVTEARRRLMGRRGGFRGRRRPQDIQRRGSSVLVRRGTGTAAAEYGAARHAVGGVVRNQATFRRRVTAPPRRRGVLVGEQLFGRSGRIRTRRVVDAQFAAIRSTLNRAGVPRR